MNLHVGILSVTQFREEGSESYYPVTKHSSFAAFRTLWITVADFPTAPFRWPLLSRHTFLVNTM
jgi:hypothetical protein